METLRTRRSRKSCLPLVGEYAYASYAIPGSSEDHDQALTKVEERAQSLAELAPSKFRIFQDHMQIFQSPAAYRAAGARLNKSPKIGAASTATLSLNPALGAVSITAM